MEKNRIQEQYQKAKNELFLLMTMLEDAQDDINVHGDAPLQRTCASFQHKVTMLLDAHFGMLNPIDDSQFLNMSIQLDQVLNTLKH